MDWRAAPYRATMAFYDCDDWDVCANPDVTVMHGVYWSA